MKKPYETTWLDLANRALARLNQNHIKNFEEGTNSSLQVELSLSSSVSDILNTNDWKSATKAVLLHPLSELNAEGKYQYNLPTDFVRLVKVDLDKAYWDREGHCIVSSVQQDILIKYVAFPNLPGTLDPLLLSAITAMCAYKISLNLTADTTIQSQLYNEANIALQSARMNENQGEPDEMYTTNDWKENY